MFLKSNKVHQEVIDLKASPDQVRDFIMTPQRIMDYYPSPLEAGVLEPGSSLYCKGKSGISLLEIQADQSHEQRSSIKVVVKVTTALKLKPPFTTERIREAAFFTMFEDWQLEPHSSGTRLTKTWRDVHKIKHKILPMSWIVRKSAKGESAHLKKAWDSVAD
ncbi:SRPBCC family protein [Endozoicomonas numazuensis]|uniref:Polyketide cyclase n=1 Tax=Endozoicomonas numazuensis TaxID=1137799 RepID=A0A081NFF3_9GAMM|nr:SRPBCC family protein [Endozoicomonas numazuensis]KEQ17176.1 hypothetical protein GZ78_15120 [Endozoicomonas numazuensis]